MAGFAIKVKTKGGQRILRDLTTQTTLGELKSVLSDVSNIPVANLHILCGFPPTTLNAADENSPLSECGISSGDTLILEEKESEAPKSSLTKDHVASENFESLQASSCPGLLMKHVVPADNSCLFTSIYFALNGKVDDSGTASPWMRKLIAETVSNDTNYFSEAILGKPNADYCKWIQDDKSWGGAIEISIMADYYGIEIAVVDTINAIINRFGEDKNFPHRVFLLFDGIHYDPLFLEPIDGGDIQTIFQSTDERIYSEAEELAKEAKSSRQYTDVNKFTLKCLVCNIFMSGQTQAQQHAKTTGHTKFGEI